MADAYNKHKAMSSDEFCNELNFSIVSSINALREFEEKILQDRNEPIEWPAVHLEGRTNSKKKSMLNLFSSSKILLSLFFKFSFFFILIY
jgi:hypothetical protein